MSGWRRKRGGWAVIGLWFLAGGLAGPAPAQMSESFEYGVPPPGWTKTNLLGGGGWYQLPIGTMPLPGWGNGTSSVPATANAGTHNAYCSWTTGGGAGEGYHNDQWLISPRLTGLTATSTVSYWLRFNFTNFPDTVYFRVSTNGPAPADFTYVACTNFFARGSYTNQFPPWSNHVVNVGALGIPAGTPIWVAIQEYEWDNVHNGAAIQLDVIESDLTAPPEARTGPTSLVFTAYYEGVAPAAQTFALQSIGSSGLGYSSSLAFGAGPAGWLTVGGPASGTIDFQGSQVYTASVSVAGLDLGTYYATNVITVPGATNSPLRVPITLNVIRRPQTISFANPGPQYTTNHLGLAGTASSGLQVTFSVFSGPGNIVGATNLSFTGTGTVKVVAWQLGNVYYDVAPCVTQALAVTKPNAVITITNLSYVYDGSPHGATVTTEPEGLTVDTTYNGSASLPVAIGSYAVTSTVNDVLYGGTATAVFTITRMPQTVDFPDPGAQWTTSVVGLAATASSGLPVTFSVASGPGTIGGGTNLSFTGAGTVSVVATQVGDADWLPAAATNAIAVSKAEATVALGSLSQTYDGSAKSATATTDPAGLTVDFTYDGSGTAPANAGSYAVTGTVNDTIYFGSDSGTLTIAKAGATVTLTNLSQTYDGTPRNAAAETVPAGLAVDFTYDGSTNAPVARGSYAVTGTVNDANWAGSATGTLTVAMGVAGVTLGSLAQEYDGAPRSATATTVPAGLTVDFTYDGTTNLPVAVGSYAVTGTVNDADWAGSATGTLVIGKGTAAIMFGDLAQTYDGTVKSVTATTAPTGLVVEITYDGSATAPSAVGSYAVTGTVNDANWQGTNTGTLTIGKAVATVTLTNLLHTFDGTAKNATVTTDPAGLTVDLTYDGAATAPSNAGSYAVTGTVNDADWQGLATGTLVIAKAAAVVTLDSLAHTYDGTAKSAAATTDPAGLAVIFTYDGATNNPVAAGSYAVTGTVDEVNWQGSATGTLTIANAAATVALDSLAHTYDGTAKSATATTDPAGLAVVFTYNGVTNIPVAAGSYVVTGMVNEANYAGSATGTLTIAKATADVTLGGLLQYYNGKPKPATATTVPPGLTVEFTYDGATNPPTAVGSYVVTGTVNDANYTGSAAGLLTVEPRALDLKINCGGPAISGATPWLADTGFVGGGVWTTAAVVLNTTSAPMAVYRAERSSAPLRYNLASIPDGTYEVILHFSEMSTAGARGKRVSNVFIEGAQVLTNLDVYAAAGGSLRALVRSFVVTVADGNGLQIELTKVAGYPQINGIEILSEGPPTPAIVTSAAQVTVPESGTATFGVRLNVAPESDTTVTVARASGDADITVTGGASLVFTPANYAATQTVTLAAANDADSAAGTATIQCTAAGYATASVTATEQDNDVPAFSLKVNCGGPALAGGWLADTGFVGGGVWTTTSAVANATQAPMELYQRERSSAPLRYSLASVPNGTYLVRLHFNDMSSPGGAGRRVCNVSLEGVRVETNLDVFVQAGGRMRALVKSYSVTVSGGNGLQIELTRVAGYPQLNGIEVSSGLGAAPPGAKARLSAADVLAPAIVLSSADREAPGAGWAAVDGDLETAWQAGGNRGSWICLGYAQPVQVRAVDVQFAAGSPLGLYTLASDDAVNWFELEPELELGPVELNYLWFIFPPAPLEPPAAVREIEIQGIPGP